MPRQGSLICIFLRSEVERIQSGRPCKYTEKLHQDPLLLPRLVPAPSWPLEGGLCPLSGAFRVQHPSVHDLVHIHKPSEVGAVIPFVQMRKLERASPPHHLGSGSAEPRTQAWSPPGPWSTATLRCWGRCLYAESELGHLYAVLLPSDLCPSPCPRRPPAPRLLWKDIFSLECCYGSSLFPVGFWDAASLLWGGLSLCTFPFSTGVLLKATVFTANHKYWSVFFLTFI